MSYKHLTIEDRSKIEVLYQEGYTACQIAEAIGRYRSTIYRELKRVESVTMRNWLKLTPLDINLSKVVVLNIRRSSFKIFKQS